jgi:hypothetical protein
MRELPRPRPRGAGTRGPGDPMRVVHLCEKCQAALEEGFVWNEGETIADGPEARNMSPFGPAADGAPSRRSETG